MIWLLCSYLPLLLLSASASALTPSEQIEQNALPCPAACQDKGPESWSLYSAAERLAVCPEPLLLAFGLSTMFNDTEADNPIYACTLGNAETKTNLLTEQSFVDPDAMSGTNLGPGRRRAAAVENSCGAGSSKRLETPVMLSSWDGILEPKSNSSGADAVVAMSKFKEYLEETPTDCGKTIMFAYYRGTLVGLYSGPQVDRHKTLESLTPTLNHAVKSSSNTRYAVEACNKRSANDVFGLVVDPTGDFTAVQAVVKSWNEGICVTSTKTKSIDAAFAWGSKTASNAGTQSPMRSTKVKVLADGVCASYETKMGDICDAIAKQNGISIDDLGKWNKKTWGWDGCDNLQPFVRICVSAGNPPMPASVWNAECGPTRNDTAPPQNGEELADLNPCPLNVCCNRWGMCGLVSTPQSSLKTELIDLQTNDYCLKSKSSTGNPGTGQKGEAGCISNCERTLTNNNMGPQKFRKIGYFEAWNYDRPCLNMHVKDIDKSYSHIHFSFAEISKNLSVVIPSNVQQQFQSFLNGTNLPAKKIIAFGGWAFSNEGTGTGLFRKAVAPNNRQAFANRVVRFVVENKLDGVDFDWEYPGATDIDGSEPGQESDGENYFQFLKLVREKLPKEKTVSIAAPASFWYLKSFPIKKMAGVLDYIIYMTYDLHGKVTQTSFHVHHCLYLSRPVGRW